MKKLAITFLLFSLLLPVFAQHYKRNDKETAYSFINRVKPSNKVLAHSVIETKWNSRDKDVIIAFWQDANATAPDVVGSVFVPILKNSYAPVMIDNVGKNASFMPVKVLAVSFYDVNKDGKEEMLVIYSWTGKNAKGGDLTYFKARVYDSMNYNLLPSKLTVMEEIDGGRRDANTQPIFSNVMELRAYLAGRGNTATGVTPPTTSPARPIPAPGPSVTPSPTVDFTKSYMGTLGSKMEAVFNITADKGKITGFYYYKTRGADINLVGTVNGNQIDMYELDYTGLRTARITGTYSKWSFIGKWVDLKSGATYPVTLKEMANSKIKPLPNNIVGAYSTPVADRACNIKVNISRSKDGYFYAMQISNRKVSGTVSFKREADGSLSYVELDDFKWGDYKGDVSNSANLKSQDMYGLSCHWEDGKLAFQNYGNDTNYYVKVVECEAKYIVLERAGK